MELNSQSYLRILLLHNTSLNGTTPKAPLAVLKIIKAFQERATQPSALQVVLETPRKSSNINISTTKNTPGLLKAIVLDRLGIWSYLAVPQLPNSAHAQG